jgi:putative endonuclease
MSEWAYVYILASKGRRLYIGVTNCIEVRIFQHKEKRDPRCFTARYNIDRLVYFERFTSIKAAISREKELKGWLRERKIALIVANNPTWKDLSLEWGKPIEPFREEKLRKPITFGDPEAIAEARAKYGDPSRSAQDDDVPF